MKKSKVLNTFKNQTLSAYYKIFLSVKCCMYPKWTSQCKKKKKLYCIRYACEGHASASVTTNEADFLLAAGERLSNSICLLPCDSKYNCDPEDGVCFQIQQTRSCQNQSLFQVRAFLCLCAWCLYSMCHWNRQRISESVENRGTYRKRVSGGELFPSGDSQGSIWKPNCVTPLKI